MRTPAALAMANVDAVLRDELADALRADDRAVRRLGRAGTSVAFWVEGDDAASATVLLDRQPPEVVDSAEPAEVTIHLTREDAARFARGELVLPTAIYCGLVTCEGAVRPYLAVDPILRGLLRRRALAAAASAAAQGEPDIADEEDCW